jgi:rhomboid family GlyGly-CTERM serine protease
MRLSAAERAALALAAAVVLLQALPLGDVLEYRRPLLGAEPWRALTAHLVHVNWPHALVNAAALVIVARLFAPDIGIARQLLVLVVSAIAISVGLALAYPGIAWYRGLSGVLHALFFAGATAWTIGVPREIRRMWLPAALLLGGWIKVVFEQPSGAGTPFSEWLGAATVPQAHLLGAVCGTALGLIFAALDARSRSKGSEQQKLR